MNYPGPVPAPVQQKPKRRGRGLLVGGVAVGVLGVLGAAFIGGWVMSAQWAAGQTFPETAPSVVMVPQVPEGVRMPDLRGLSRSDALQVIADAGWDVSKVATTTEPFAGPEDIVVAQTPPFGVTDVPAISLTLSTRAVVPNYAGMPSADIVTQLRNLGVNVQLNYAYDPAIPAGQVVKVTPEAGQALPTDATVTIAEAGTAVFLSEVKCADGCLSRQNNMVINGKSYANSVYGQVRAGETRSHAYLLGRHASEFIATVGIPDTVSDTSGTIKVTILADGKSLETVTFAYGEAVELRVAVSGVLRLDLQMSFDKPPAQNYASQQVSFGDARLVGADAEMAQVPRS